MRRARRTGWLIGLRRRAALGLVLFALVFTVSALRGEAIALSVGDEPLCVAVGGPPRPVPSDPTDLADAGHVCCDLCLCPHGGALTPTLAEPVRGGWSVAAQRSRMPRSTARLARRRRAHTPRGPPRP